jgi:hypothetical protein
MANKFYGRALRVLLKQQDEKPTIANEKHLIDLIKTMELNYVVYFYETEFILKYPKAYMKF